MVHQGLLVVATLVVLAAGEEAVNDSNESDVYCIGKYDLIAKPRNPSALSVGKIEALSKEFPHMAVLGLEKDNETSWVCGGSLIDKQHVLTAAYCLRSRTGDIKYVRLGDLNLANNKDDSQPQDFTVAELIPHPDYKPPSQYYDIGIIKLDRPVEITPYVIPACLNKKRELPEGIFTATGWGQIDFGGPGSDSLRKITLNEVKNDVCRKVYPENPRRLVKGIDDESQICANSPKTDTCAGDGGGPLQRATPHGFAIYGITSFGKGACGLVYAPGVYTRVSHYIDWIKSVIEKP